MKISKEEILKECIQKQNDLIDGFRTRLKEMENDAFKSNESASQTEDRSAGNIELLNAVGRELDFAMREMEFLKTLTADENCTIVEPGAVVVTDKMTFYISTSIERFNVEKHELFGISVKAPIYAAMRGMEKGADFKFNESEYKIKDIY